MGSKLFQRRLKKARLFAGLFSAVPFVRMIGLNGSMTKGTMKENSDIDFLIIAHHGRIWTARFLTILLAVLIGQRQSAGRSAGKLCLNRYHSDQFLEIKPHNFYHAETFAPLVPLYDSNIYPNYQKANVWMKRFGFNIEPGIKIKTKNMKTNRPIQQLGEFVLSDRLGNYLEKFLRSYQMRIIKKNKRMTEATAGRVRISDWELCFHQGAR